MVSAWQEEWNELSPSDQALKRAGRGVNYPGLEGLIVADSETLKGFHRMVKLWEKSS